jgi:hypothetical protein
MAARRAAPLAARSRAQRCAARVRAAARPVDASAVRCASPGWGRGSSRSRSSARCVLPTWMLALGPIVLGVPHIAADLRYLVARPGLHARGWSSVAVLGPLAAGALSGRLYYGLLATAVAVLVSRVAVVAQAAGVALAGGLAALSWRYQGWSELVFAHAHNLVAVLLWWAWRPRTGRGHLVPLGLFAIGSVALLSGALRPTLRRMGHTRARARPAAPRTREAARAFRERRGRAALGARLRLRAVGPLHDLAAPRARGRPRPRGAARLREQLPRARPTSASRWCSRPCSAPSSSPAGPCSISSPPGPATCASPCSTASSSSVRARGSCSRGASGARPRDSRAGLA